MMLPSFKACLESASKPSKRLMVGVIGHNTEWRICTDTGCLVLSASKTLYAIQWVASVVNGLWSPWSFDHREDELERWHLLRNGYMRRPEIHEARLELPERASTILQPTRENSELTDCDATSRSRHCNHTFMHHGWLLYSLKQLICNYWTPCNLLSLVAELWIGGDTYK